MHHLRRRSNDATLSTMQRHTGVICLSRLPGMKKFIMNCSSTAHWRNEPFRFDSPLIAHRAVFCTVNTHLHYLSRITLTATASTPPPFIHLFHSVRRRTDQKRNGKQQQTQSISVEWASRSKGTSAFARANIICIVDSSKCCWLYWVWVFVEMSHKSHQCQWHHRPQSTIVDACASLLWWRWYGEGCNIIAYVYVCAELADLKSIFELITSK